MIQFMPANHPNTNLLSPKRDTLFLAWYLTLYWEKWFYPKEILWKTANSIEFSNENVLLYGKMFCYLGKVCTRCDDVSLDIKEETCQHIKKFRAQFWSCWTKCHNIVTCTGQNVIILQHGLDELSWYCNMDWMNCHNIVTCTGWNVILL